MARNPLVEAGRMDNESYQRRHFLATVVSSGGGHVTITRNGQTTAEGPYAANAALGAVSPGDIVWVVDLTGNATWAVVMKVV